MLQGLANARGIAGEARLRRCRGSLDGEDLLFDGIVQVASQAVAFLLSGGVANLLLVFRAQWVAWRGAAEYLSGAPEQ